MGALMGDRSKENWEVRQGVKVQGAKEPDAYHYVFLTLNNHSKHMSAHFAKDESIALSWWQM